MNEQKTTLKLIIPHVPLTRSNLKQKKHWCMNNDRVTIRNLQMEIFAHFLRVKSSLGSAVSFDVQGRLTVTTQSCDQTSSMGGTRFKSESRKVSLYHTQNASES